MASTLTEAEILNTAADTSGLGIFDDPAADDSLEARRVRLAYKVGINALSSRFPWTFLSKNDDLYKDATYSEPGFYQYRYQVPRDAKFIWEIYKTESSFRGLSYTGTGYPFFQVGVGRAFDPEVVSRDVAELIDGRIYSNIDGLKILYTRSGVADPEAFSSNFVDLLIMRMQEHILKSRQVSPDSLAVTLRENDAQRDSILSVESLQNRHRGARIEPSETLAKIRGL